MQRIIRTNAFVILVFLLIGLLSLSSAHPVYQHRFNSIVNSNPCLKKCMTQAAMDDLELSLLKTANFSGYLLNLNDICSTISIARACVDSCGVDSNPFALESMNEICASQAVSDVNAITPCLVSQANGVIDQCKAECGDYDAINDLVHKMTEELRPESSHPSKIADVMGKTNEACGTLKCSNRCAAKKLAEECEPLDDGRMAGAVLRSLIERVLAAQRRDLERMHLVEQMSHSVPPQCNFMYTPESMFNETKDAAAMGTMEKERQPMAAVTIPTVVQAGVKTVEEEKRRAQQLSLALSEFQAQLLRKQLHLLDLQEQNMMRESQKLDMELQLLARKRMPQAQNMDDRLFKQF